jgi:hypothetical protein
MPPPSAANVPPDWGRNLPLCVLRRSIDAEVVLTSALRAARSAPRGDIGEQSPSWIRDSLAPQGKINDGLGAPRLSAVSMRPTVGARFGPPRCARSRGRSQTMFEAGLSRWLPNTRWPRGFGRAFRKPQPVTAGEALCCICRTRLRVRQ